MTTAIEARYAAAAEKGALLLDIHFPGWAQEIDEDELNLGSCCDCILGQIFGFYSTGCKILGLETFGDRIDHGFTLPNTELTPTNWRLLATAWLVQIRKRLPVAPIDPDPDADPMLAVGMTNCPRELIEV